MDKETVKHVANLARLKLSEEEIEKFAIELSVVEDSFSEIKKIDTEKVNPTFQPVEIKNVLREDKEKESLSEEEVFDNTEHKEDGYFKGPRIV